jgi:hypothetical protein
VLFAQMLIVGRGQQGSNLMPLRMSSPARRLKSQSISAFTARWSRNSNRHSIGNGGHFLSGSADESVTQPIIAFLPVPHRHCIPVGARKQPLPPLSHVDRDAANTVNDRYFAPNRPRRPAGRCHIRPGSQRYPDLPQNCQAARVRIRLPNRPTPPNGAVMMDQL